MRCSKINNVSIFILILCFYIARFALSDCAENVFLIYLIPTFWVTLFIYLKAHKPYESRLNIKQTDEKLLLIAVILTVYFLVHLGLGLFVSYGKNPYYPNALINLWKYVFYIFFQEYVRFVMMNSSKKKNTDTVHVISLFIFIGIEIQPKYFLTQLSCGGLSDSFIYTIIPIILNNLLSTYFVKVYDRGYLLSSIYRIYLGLYTYSVPVYPNIKNQAVLLLKIIMIIFIFLECEITNKSRHPYKTKLRTKKQIRNSNNIFYLAVFSTCIPILLFISGITKYSPVSVFSGSMQGSIEIGDMVIVERVDHEYAVSSIRQGIVVAYRLNNIIVVHRILKVNKSLSNSEPSYITKGDHNNDPDEKKVLPDQIIGIVRYKLPYVGYPSVLIKKYLF